MEKSTENVIEFLNGQKTCAVTFNSRKYITKIRRLHDKYPDDFDYLEENKDGSICARIPVSWIRISRPRELTEEQKEVLAERMKAVRQKQLQSVAE